MKQRPPWAHKDRGKQEMEVSSLEEIVTYLKINKALLYDKFGVTRLGVFGSFVEDEQTESSDIDMVVEFEKDKKNIHSFLQLKRFLERELSRKVDLGFEHALKPIVRQTIKEKITYV
jgi:predicted nucleotidyltransferase